MSSFLRSASEVRVVRFRFWPVWAPSNLLPSLTVEPSEVGAVVACKLSVEAAFECE